MEGSDDIRHGGRGADNEARHVADQRCLAAAHGFGQVHDGALQRCDALFKRGLLRAGHAAHGEDEEGVASKHGEASGQPVSIMSLAPWLAAVREDLYGRVLPFWLTHSPDRVHGGFFNCLDEDGAKYDTKVPISCV